MSRQFLLQLPVKQLETYITSKTMGERKSFSCVHLASVQWISVHVIDTSVVYMKPECRFEHHLGAFVRGYYDLKQTCF